MRKRKNIRIALLAILTGAFIILASSATSPAKEKPAKESMDQCCQKKASGSGKTTWENLSGQFFSSI